jgi:hypothetical protein
MTASTLIERVTEVPAGAGYRRVGTPREIAGLPAAFCGGQSVARSPFLPVADAAFEDQRAQSSLAVQNDLRISATQSDIQTGIHRFSESKKH